MQTLMLALTSLHPGFLAAAGVIFAGLLGVCFAAVHLVMMLIAIELILLGACLIFITYGALMADPAGMVMALFLFAVAAAEVAMGLAFCVLYFRKNGHLSFRSLNALRG